MASVTIKILQPGDEEALEAFLLPRIDSSMFLLNNLRAAGLVDNGQQLQGTYAAGIENSAANSAAISGVVAHFWNRNIVLQAPRHLLDTLWRTVVKASGRPVGGLVGPQKQVAVVKETLHPPPEQIQLDEKANLYSLDLADLRIPPALRSGQVRGRRIEPRDIELMTNWRVAYAIELLAEKDSPRLRAACRALIERSLIEQSMWILEADGRPVACTAFNSAVPEAVQVGGVWTPPELRGRGYARSIVAQSLLEAREEGVQKAILFTGVNNFPARKAYTALGFQHTGDYHILLLKSALKIRWEDA